MGEHTGEFRGVVTTTISADYRAWLKEHRYNVSHALAYGVKKLMDRENGEPEVQALMKNIKTLQDEILRLNIRIRELEKINENT